MLNLSGLRLEWESNLTNVDVTLTGGFEFNSIVDALTMPSNFWKGAFSIPEGESASEELKHFSNLGWFCKQVWDDGRRACFLKQPGDFPPALVFYSRGWFTPLNMSFEEYLENMLSMYGAKGWQFFFIDLTADIPYLQDVLEDMRVIAEQFPLLFPEKDWSHLRAKHEDARKLLA